MKGSTQNLRSSRRLSGLIALLLLGSILLPACSVFSTPEPTPTPTPIPPTSTPLPTDTPPPSPTPTETATPTVSFAGLPIVGPVYYWIRTEKADGSRIEVPNPSYYTTTFSKEGTLAGVADCNNYTGNFTAQGGELGNGPMTIEILATTLAACPEGSLGQEFVTSLANVEGFAILGTELYLTQKDNLGNLVFSLEAVAIAIPTATRPAPTQVFTPVPPKIYVATTRDSVNVRSGPGSSYPSYGVVPAGTSGVVVDQTADKSWVAIRIPTSVAKDGKGWINGSVVTITEANSATATAIAGGAKPVTTGTPNATQPPIVTTACQIVSVKPAAGKEFNPNTDFDMVVELKNTGTSDWDPAKVDIRFISAVGGVTLHQGGNAFDLQALVKPQENYTVIVDMKAPGSAGSYGETWALADGNTVLCQWNVSITVK